jgi:DNA polymerase-3 subunit epsilon
MDRSSGFLDLLAQGEREGQGREEQLTTAERLWEGRATMFKNLVLEKPLAIIDLETTGTDPQSDRIVEIGLLRVTPDGRRCRRVFRLNPGVPIPPAATEVHGITDEDVAEEPRFADVAADLLVLLDGCDLCGFNLKRFDLRVLHVEFARAGKALSLQGRAIVDALEIFFAHEKRDLTAAVRFYCNREHENAHSAGADAMATAEVLDAMLARYQNLPRTAAGLHQHFKDPNAVDSNGCFVCHRAPQIRPPLGALKLGHPISHDQTPRTTVTVQDFLALCCRRLRGTLRTDRGAGRTAEPELPIGQALLLGLLLGAGGRPA